MKLFKSTKFKNKPSDKVLGYIHCGLQNIGRKLRIPSRIRLLNIRATRAPVKYMSACLTIFAVIVLYNLGSILLMKETDKPNLMSDIVNIQPIISGMGGIQNGKKVQQTELISMIEKGETIQQELDSLTKLPEKSKADSIDIVRKHNQIKILINSLSQQTP